MKYNPLKQFLLLAVLIPLMSCGDEAVRKPTGSGSTAGPGGAKGGAAKEIVLPGVVVNRVRYVVGNLPITTMDIARMKSNMRYFRRSRAMGQVAKTAEEELINRAIVRIEAARESLIVSPRRVQNEIQRRKDVLGVSDQAAFQKLMRRQAGMPYDIWLEDMPYQIMRRQIIQLKIRVPPPTKQQMQKFYRKNRRQVGLEVAFRELVFQPRGVSSERRLASLARRLHGELRRNPGSFARVARTTPSNRSPYKRYGGYRTYIPLHQLARESNRLAGVLFRLSPGQIGPVFVDERRRIRIVQLVSKRATPFDKISRIIRQRLMGTNEEKHFLKWLEKRKKEIAILKLK